MSADTSVRQIITVSVLVALVCSLVVTATVLLLRPLHRNHETVDYNRAVLSAAGLVVRDDAGAHEIAARVAALETRYLDVDHGQLAAGAAPESMPVYLVPGDTSETRIVLPAYGKGMWSTIRLFIGVGNDWERITTLVVHSHEETPGIGDRIEDPQWLASWRGKQFSDEGKPILLQLKRGPSAKPGNDGVDLISGATVTAQSVVDIVNHWLGEDGYGPHLRQLAGEPEQAP